MSKSSTADKDTPSPAESKALSRASSTSAVSTWPPPLGPADLYQPMEDTIIPLWFNAYLYLPQDPSVRSGFMEVLPGMYSNAPPGSHLHLSTLAVGFFTIAAWTGQGPLLRESERCFLRALPKVREALQSPKDADVDTMLVSILLLSTYEELAATKDSEHPVRTHLRGAIALINEKRSKPTITEQAPSQQISHAIEAQIIKNSRTLVNPMVPTPKIWPLPHARSPSPKVILSSVASQIVHLRQTWEFLQTQAFPKNETQIKNLLKKANEIDINLVSWSHWLPEHWRPIPATIIPPSVREAGMYRNRCDAYTDMWIALTWNTFRDCRILVQRIMLSCLRMKPSFDPDGTRDAAISMTLRKLADDVCASVPYFLGDQVESVRMKSGLVRYPWAETRPVTQTMSAPLMGPWHVLPFLKNLFFSGLGLPPEQVSWIGGQINRVLVIYFQR
ncbi:hypothetical protein N7532_001569 [Penicillium argentinense]|uniref:Uncharacterized protein n=1 Tax=Penicillium argentinense TaxID=1131581 RepID=A0A9W9G2S0_9EURO|nr:uncharacterized protein N7532_001569 [Penicillium argentinense]KAJ5111034.1 hypothetical protein N7532_001569 [Penicillium argentinense]